MLSWLLVLVLLSLAVSGIEEVNEVLEDAPSGVNEQGIDANSGLETGPAELPSAEQREAMADSRRAQATERQRHRAERAEEMRKRLKEEEEARLKANALPPVAEEAKRRGVRMLQVNGNALNMGGELGPIIVNKDGTVRRIANWADLTSHERETAFRRISKRNRDRLAHLSLDPDTTHELPEVEDGTPFEVRRQAVPAVEDPATADVH